MNWWRPYLQASRTCSVRVTRQISKSCCSPNFIVLKSTGSAFEKFIRDEHTTLVEVNDRIFSTSVDLKYTFASFSVPKNTSLDSFALTPELSAEGTAWDGNHISIKARTATLEVFAQDESASVQVRYFLVIHRNMT